MKQKKKLPNNGKALTAEEQLKSALHTLSIKEEEIRKLSSELILEKQCRTVEARAKTVLVENLIIANKVLAIQNEAKEKRTEESLHAIKVLPWLQLDEQMRFASIVNSTDDAILGSTIDGVIKTWNRGAEKMFGYTSNEIIGKHVSTLSPEHLQEESGIILKKTNEGTKVIHYETKRIRKNGTTFDTSITISPITDKDGKITGASKILRDISNQKKAESELFKSNRMYAFISAINQMIVKTSDETMLLQQACQIAVDIGKFKMAWVGKIDEETKEVIPLVHAGEEQDYLTIMKTISIDDIPEGQGPTGKSLREGRYIVSNDIANDPKMTAWKKDAAKRGYLSSISFPIRKLGKIVVAYTLYAPVKNFFDMKEIALLEGVASDISHAIKNIERKAIQNKTEALIIESEEVFKRLFNESANGTLLLDDTGFTRCNDAAILILGRTSREEIIGRQPWEISPEKQPDHSLSTRKQEVMMHRALKNGYHFFEWMLSMPDGSTRSIEVMLTSIVLNDKQSYYTVFRDISKRKKSEKERISLSRRLSLATHSAGMGIWDWNTANNDLKWDEGMYKLYEVDKNHVGPLFGVWAARMHPDDIDEMFANLKDAVAGKKEYDTVFRLVLNDNSIRYIKSSGILERDLEDKELHMIGVNWDITELKEKENHLIVSSNELESALTKLNKVMDSSLDVICAIDAEGYALQVSAASEAVLGYKPEELIGKQLLNYVYSEDKEITKVTATKVMEGNRLHHFENRYVHKDGTVVPIEWSVRWDAQEGIRYGIARDITEKKRLEKAFEIERKQFFDLFFDAPSSMAVLKGPDHRYEMANPLYLKLIGKKNIIGKTVREVLPEVTDQGFIEILDRVYQTGKLFSAKEMLVQLDVENNEKPVDLYLNILFQPHMGSEEKIDGILFFGVDVTEQVNSRKKIEESEVFNRSILNSLSAHLAVANNKGEIISTNDAWNRFALGNGETSLARTGVGSNYFEVCKKAAANGDDIAAKVMRGMKQVLNKKLKNFYIEYPCHSPAEQRWFGLHISKFETDEPLALLVHTDLTARTLAEFERQKLTDDLINRNQGLEQFTYIVSHNLRAPVANIQGLSDLLMSSTMSADESEQIAKNLLTSARNLDAVLIDLNNILKLKIDISKARERIIFSGLVEEIEKNIYALLQKENVTIVTHFEEAPEMISLKSYVYSIFYNLISNSIAYKKPGAQSIIEIKSVERNSEIELLFKDNGRGIDLENKGDQVFGLYKRFHPDIEGKGLGLFMVKTQVEALGGKITIKSKINEGTEFKIIFKKEIQHVY